MNASLYELSEWSQPNFRAVNKFYRSQKHKGSASGDDRVFIITHQEDIVAAVRLVPYQDQDQNQDYYWLRGLYVKSELRGTGLGQQLLAFVKQKLAQQIEQPIYCFPYTHLEHFYQKSDYKLLSPQELPVPLLQLFNKYSGKGEGIICMVQ